MNIIVRLVSQKCDITVVILDRVDGETISEKKFCMSMIRSAVFILKILVPMKKLDVGCKPHKLASDCL